jgi:hypothetical protein
VDRICVLSDAQRKKLQLAGRGDIKRFFDHVEESRKQIHHEPIGRAELMLILQEFQRRPPNSRPDLFGESSLFSKTLKNTLSADQFARYQKVTRDEIAAHHRSTIKWVVGNMDTTLRLSQEQHRRLEVLLVEETQPPKRFGEYDYYGVLFQMSLLSPKKLRRIFDDEQWGKLTLQFGEAARLGPMLKEGGFLPVDEMAKAAPRPSETARQRDEKPQG